PARTGRDAGDDALARVLESTQIVEIDLGRRKLPKPLGDRRIAQPARCRERKPRARETPDRFLDRLDVIPHAAGSAAPQKDRRERCEPADSPRDVESLVDRLASVAFDIEPDRIASRPGEDRAKERRTKQIVRPRAVGVVRLGEEKRGRTSIELPANAPRIPLETAGRDAVARDLRADARVDLEPRSAFALALEARRPAREPS